MYTETVLFTHRTSCRRPGAGRQTAAIREAAQCALLRVLQTVAGALLLPLTACVGPIALTATPDANHPACTDMMALLPDTVAGLARRDTTTQATGAWGNPVGVELRCGITPSGPTSDNCVSVNGVDWIIDDSEAPLYRLEAYGRHPGLEIFVDSAQASAAATTTDLAAAVARLPQTRQCLSLFDVPSPE